MIISQINCAMLYLISSIATPHEHFGPKARTPHLAVLPLPRDKGLAGLLIGITNLAYLMYPAGTAFMMYNMLECAYMSIHA